MVKDWPYNTKKEPLFERFYFVWTSLGLRFVS